MTLVAVASLAGSAIILATGLAGRQRPAGPAVGH